LGNLLTFGKLFSSCSQSVCVRERGELAVLLCLINTF